MCKRRPQGGAFFLSHPIDRLVEMGIIDEVATASEFELRSYLAGASRDGTFSRLHNTLRISQKGAEWLEVLKAALEKLGARSWMYQETGRQVWTLETRWWDPGAPRSPSELVAFTRGYFDAEGGVPRCLDARFYIQLVQKDFDDLYAVRTGLVDLGVECGKMHNPSVRVDPEYWRFFVRARSHADFCRTVSSWHPRKRHLLDGHLGRLFRSDRLSAVL